MIHRAPTLTPSQAADLLAGALTAEQLALVEALLARGQVLTGTTEPAAELGAEGDIYLRTGETWTGYGPKTEEGWGAGVAFGGSGGAAPILPYCQPFPAAGTSTISQPGNLEIWCFPVDRWPGASILAQSIRVSAMGGTTGQFAVGWYTTDLELLGYTLHDFNGQTTARGEADEPIAVPDGTAVVAVCCTPGSPIGYISIPWIGLGFHPLAGAACLEDTTPLLATLDGEGNIVLPETIPALDVSALLGGSGAPPWLLCEC